MVISGLLTNYVLIAAVLAWAIAQAIKVPVYYLQHRRWNWAILLSPGGMPSSHSALVTAAAHAIGLFVGFGTPLFALAVVVTIVVVYDATGIRRQAGLQAALINLMIRDLASGHPLKSEKLREVLGHTPLEALGGVLLGLATAQALWLLVS
jgi:acid phosphatase family membrane protein YuiD